MPFLLLIPYLLVGFFFACRIGTLAAWSEMNRAKNGSYPSLHPEESPTWIQILVAGVPVGLLAGAVWPLTAMALVFQDKLFIPPKAVQQKRQAERIKELERDLELLR